MTAACPFHTAEAQAALSNEFDVFTFLGDPHPILARSRTEAPVFYDETSGYWVITRYESVRAAAGDPETFSSVNALDPMTDLDPRVPTILEEGQFGGRPFIVNIDGDEHREHKRIMSKVLHPRAVSAFEPRMRDLAGRCWTTYRRDKPFDFVDGFTLEFPALVIFEFLGLPAASSAMSRGGPMPAWNCSLVGCLLINR